MRIAFMNEENGAGVDLQKLLTSAAVDFSCKFLPQDELNVIMVIEFDFGDRKFSGHFIEKYRDITSCGTVNFRMPY